MPYKTRAAKLLDDKDEYMNLSIFWFWPVTRLCIVLALFQIVSGEKTNYKQFFIFSLVSCLRWSLFIFYFVFLGYKTLIEVFIPLTNIQTIIIYFIF